jgi:hypothetical protein
MTAAQKQARYRKRLKEAAKKRAAELAAARLLYQPPVGYSRAKQRLIEAGHQFKRIHDAFGREFGGVFVDGAYMATLEVIALADMAPGERKQRLAKARRAHKDVACDAVTAAALEVSLDELIAYVGSHRSVLGRAGQRDAV